MRSHRQGNDYMDNNTRSIGEVAAGLAMLLLVVGLAAIACAAPENAGGQSDGAAALAGPDSNGAQSSTGGASVSMQHAVDFAGKFHPMVLHFPIALVLTTLLAEMLGLISGKAVFSQTARFTLILAALSVLVTVPLGWAAAVSKEYAHDYARMLWLHRCFGTTTGILVILAACLSEASRAQRERAFLRTAYRFGLVLASGAVAFTGHFGSLLVYGLDYFSN